MYSDVLPCVATYCSCTVKLVLLLTLGRSLHVFAVWTDVKLPAAGGTARAVCALTGRDVGGVRTVSASIFNINFSAYRAVIGAP